MLRRLNHIASIGIAVLKSYLPAPKARPHKLPGRLIVSLTSYPPRFRTLSRTLRSLARQTVKPDAIILWIAHEDYQSLPLSVRRVHKIDIRKCPNLRSLKKIVPALEAYPDAFIATADDDLYYPTDWLERLIVGSGTGISAMSVIEPIWNGDAYLRRNDWLINEQGPFLIAGTGGGALFPPKSLHPDVADFETFDRIAGTCDDSWIAWQAARAGTPIVKVPNAVLRFIPWERTTANSLSYQNYGADFRGGVHHTVIDNLTAKYGPLHALRPI